MNGFDLTRTQAKRLAGTPKPVNPLTRFLVVANGQYWGLQSNGRLDLGTLAKACRFESRRVAENTNRVFLGGIGDVIEVAREVSQDPK